MQRTPIKIPGKRKPARDRKAKDAIWVPSKSRGGPLKLSSAKMASKSPDSSAKMTVSTKQRSMKHIKSRSKMSLLEKLPTELLEHVYLYAMDLALPRSSPVIASKLSREAIYIQTVMSAFAPVWAGPCNRICHLQDYDSQEAQKSNSSFKTAVLECRWVSLAIILKAKRLFLETHHKDCDFASIWFGPKNPDKIDPADMTPIEYVEADFALFINGIINAAEVEYKDYHCYGTPEIEKEVEIPEKLLLGPWSEDMLKYLYWLVKAGARVNFLQSTSGEVASIGLRNAIRAGNIPAMHLLLWAGLEKTSSEELFSFAVRNAGGNKLHLLNHLLAHAIHRGMTSRNHWAFYKMKYELEDIKDQAQREDDQETFALIQDVENSNWFERALKSTPRHFEDVHTITAQIILEQSSSM